MDYDKDASEEAMTTVTMTVTPAQAQDWLDKMPTQRRLRQNKVDQLIRLINEGRWQVLPHGIVIDKNGRLIDGQHRLTALVTTEKALPMRVTFNAEPSMFLQIDSSSTPKGIEDALKHEGVSSFTSMLLGTSIRMLFRIGRGLSPFQNIAMPSNEEAIEIFRANPRLVEAAEMCQSVKVAPSMSLLTFYVHEALKINDERTGLFCSQLASGLHMKPGDPALLLRNTWIKDRLASVKRTTAEQAAMIAYAINAMLAFRRLKDWRGVQHTRGKPLTIGK
jgi:hypothetical protein